MLVAGHNYAKRTRTASIAHGRQRPHTLLLSTTRHRLTNYSGKQLRPFQSQTLPFLWPLYVLLRFDGVHPIAQNWSTMHIPTPRPAANRIALSHDAGLTRSATRTRHRSCSVRCSPWQAICHRPRGEVVARGPSLCGKDVWARQLLHGANRLPVGARRQQAPTRLLCSVCRAPPPLTAHDRACPWFLVC